MFRTAASRDGGLDQVLDDLPRSFGAVTLADDRLVVGPTGAFVVAEAGPDLEAQAERLGRLAERCRASLASHLPWTPFVDVFIVAERSGDTSPLASVVPARILREILLDGPRLLTDEAVERLRAVLDAAVAVADA